MRSSRTGSNRLSVVAALFFFLGTTQSFAADPHRFVGVRKCKKCHGKELMGDQHSRWLENPHRRAYQTLGTPQSQAIGAAAGLSTPPQEAEACLRCHVTAYAVPEALLAYELDAADGVQCESCHGPGRDYRKKKIMSDYDRARSKGLWDAKNDVTLCTRCHNPESPTFDPARYTLPDGTSAGFDFSQAVERIPHPIPENVKGHYIELEKKQKAEEKLKEKD